MIKVGENKSMLLSIQRSKGSHIPESQNQNGERRMGREEAKADEEVS